MKDTIATIAFMAAAAAVAPSFADGYSTVVHARITPTNRVVTSIPAWAQKDAPPEEAMTTNVVNDLVKEYLRNGTYVTEPEAMMIALRITDEYATDNGLVTSNEAATIAYAEAGRYALDEHLMSKEDTEATANAIAAEYADTMGFASRSEVTNIANHAVASGSGYRMVRLDDDSASVTLESDRIYSLSTGASVTGIDIALKYPDDPDKSFDCILRIANGADLAVGISSDATDLDGGSEDWATAPAGVNYMTFTRTAIDRTSGKSTVLVFRKKIEE